jgi:predicted branched-subunit amino acid permease
MTIWLYSSFFIGFLGLNLGQERWLLSFVPAAFFFGVFIEKMKSDRLKNSMIFLGGFFIVFFKLFSFEVL